MILDKESDINCATLPTVFIITVSGVVVFTTKDFVVKKIFFFVDSFPSMSDEMISLVYSEISGAISQYNGKFGGELGFFDVEVTESVPFDSVNIILNIIPIGGGGTDFLQCLIISL